MSDKKDKKKYRAPVVTIMGHVDHGKTTLLDYILKSNVAGKEHGGITQHVRAYQVNHNDHPITFIDTPGHEAFVAMRERGTKVTDIIVLVVAADDGVKPQTKEVIAHWKKTNPQLIVAINKIDLPGANPEKVKRELTTEGVLLEKYGGDIPYIELSAKTGKNVGDLLDVINIVSELNELDKYKDISNAEFKSDSVVLESFTDKSMGAMAHVIIKSGILKLGEFVVSGNTIGKIRSISNDTNNRIKEAIESMPVKISGMTEVLEVGEHIKSFKDEKSAKSFLESTKKTEEQSKKKEVFNKQALASLLMSKEENKDIQKLNIILVTDTIGSLEAIEHSLKKLDVPNTELNIVHKKTGNVALSDIQEASTKGSIVLLFNTKAPNSVSKAADDQGVLMREYNIIYELIEEIEGALLGLIEPEKIEEIVGVAEVRQVFKLSNKKYIAGCRVVQDKIIKGYRGYIVRGKDDERVFDGKIQSLKHEKADIKEATNNTECGIMFDQNFEPQEGDHIICYKMVSNN